jgi:hypothetical protein
MPPTPPAAAKRPTLRTDALNVDSPSLSGILDTAKPAAATTARAPTRKPNGAEFGVTRLTPASTALTTRSAANTDNPAAIPWCIAARGINDGPNEANNARVLNGADELFVIGLRRSATRTATSEATVRTVMIHPPSCAAVG